MLSYVKSYIFDNYWYLYEENGERNAYVQTKHISSDVLPLTCIVSNVR
jgi:hypothetical protein